MTRTIISYTNTSWILKAAFPIYTLNRIELYGAIVSQKIINSLELSYGNTNRWVKRAKFSITMTVVFFMMFAGNLLVLFSKDIVPHYFLVIVFAIPFVSFL